MKLMIASDIHGSAYYCRKMLEAYDRRKGRQAPFIRGYFISRPPQ